MEKENSRTVAGETVRVAAAEDTVVVVPVILEVAEVEIEVTIRVGVHVRHPVVAVGGPRKLCIADHPFHRKQHQPPPEFHSEP